MKSPKFIECAAEVLADRRYLVDHVLIPVRELDAAAQSRRQVEAAHRARLSLTGRLRRIVQPTTVPGGLWGTRSTRPGAQEAVLGEKLSSLRLALADSNVPVTLLRFPRLAEDPRYLFEKVEPLLDGTPFGVFATTFHRIARRPSPEPGGTT